MTAYIDLEKKVIKQFGNFLNYSGLESNLYDNATAFEFDEIRGLNPIQLKSVIESLTGKGLLSPDDVNGDPIIRVTDKGVEEYYRLFVNEAQEEDIVFFGENKQLICNLFLLTLQHTRKYSDLTSLTYDDKAETVTAQFAGGGKKIAYVAADSGSAMLYDILLQIG